MLYAEAAYFDGDHCAHVAAREDHRRLQRIRAQARLVIEAVRGAFPGAFTIRVFECSEDAYDACQCDAGIKAGDIVVGEHDQTLAMGWVWPVAVTENKGEFHDFKDAGVFTASDAMAATPEQLRLAIEEAQRRGWPVDPRLLEKGEQECTNHV